jgi:hypothetical protein
VELIRIEDSAGHRARAKQRRETDEGRKKERKKEIETVFSILEPLMGDVNIPPSPL